MTTKADTSVKTATYSWTGAPVLNGVAGSLITLLDAFLVNGWGTKTVSSLVVSAEVATLTVSTGHDFVMIGPYTGPVIAISGAGTAALNDEWRIDSIPNTTTLTFLCPGVADGTVSGTMSVKYAPCGWERYLASGNIVAYRPTAVFSQKRILRVDDSVDAQSARIVSYETMSDIDTGTVPLQNVAGGSYVPKSNIAGNASARNYLLVGNETGFWFFAAASYSSFGFYGELLSDFVGDAYRTVIMFPASSSLYSSFANSIGWATVDGLPGGVQTQTVLAPWFPYVANARPGMIGQAVDANGRQPLYNHVMCASASPYALRGRLPGLVISHASLPSARTVVSGVVINGTLRDAMSVTARYDSGNSTSPCIDVSGPWEVWEVD